jgi:hypothetical protein
MTCKECGWALEDWQVFCPGCGRRTRRVKPVWLWGGLALVLVGVTAVLGYRIYLLRQPEPVGVSQAPKASQPDPEPVKGVVPKAEAALPVPKTAAKASEQPSRRIPETPVRIPDSPPAKPSEPKPAKAPARRLNIPTDDFDEPPQIPGLKAELPPPPEEPTGIPVVPGTSRPSGAPRPKIGILRPERAEPGPAREEPSAREPAPQAPAPYTGPSAGTLIWSGDIRENTLVVINGSDVSVGRLTGELPGVPVIIELETDDFLVIDPPGPANQWKRLSLRSRRSVRQAVVVKWGVMK